MSRENKTKSYLKSWGLAKVRATGKYPQMWSSLREQGLIEGQQLAAPPFAEQEPGWCLSHSISKCPGRAPKIKPEVLPTGQKIRDSYPAGHVLKRQI